MKWRCFYVVEYDDGRIEVARLESSAALDAPHGYVDCGVLRPIAASGTAHLSDVLRDVGGDFES